ncbi:DNA replication/repair protein RecF [Aureitalea marina]|uniref:DNA replication and repair protein RecF n=1 Tax=Aureitalea marina TaxID=930804 RepID=A0A2S7KTM9_9FLAO|nr:DNA replication/repair protein RecF [Aureitalea marina]PQB05995.1 DNA recombination protein RecF [Aureitalea marina]
MRLESLALLNYKNFETQRFEFDPRINCLVGNNGVGKTNVLDAIYHLSFGKSYFNPVTSQNITHGKDFFVIEGDFEKSDQPEKVVVSVKRGQKKIIKRNGKIYERFRDHIGFIPLVIISPSDRDLIIEGSETRRKFMDGVISQGDADYLRALLSYNKLLVQRNSLLKYFVANRTFKPDTLAVYDDQMDALAAVIHGKRKDFIQAFTPIFQGRHKAISSGNEEVALIYQSQLDEAPLHQLMQASLEKDRFTQFTNYGIHKDDLLFRIGDKPIKKFGSQGQQKSYLIALKLAQFDFLKGQTGVNPILLLDDVFDKLDEERVARIIQLVDQEDFGQLFISDTHADRTEEVVKQVHQSYKMIRL